MRADFWTKSPQQKLSDIGPKGSKKVKNCTKLVHFFTRDGRLRSKWTLFTLFGHYFKNTHSRHYVPLIDERIGVVLQKLNMSEGVKKRCSLCIRNLVRAVILFIVPPHALDTHSKATVVCILDLD